MSELIYIIAGIILLGISHLVERYYNKHYPEIMKDPEE